MRTRAEVRAFLDSQVGKTPVHVGNPGLNGQCVTLTKVLMDFLGVPNPYAARGDAINAGDTYIRQGLGTPGRGWLTICVNRDMGYIGGVHYGHIWIDLLNESNYESNGARALVTTKNTRPVQQAQQFINFDKWIGDDDMKVGQQVGYDTLNKLHHQIIGNWDMSKAYWDSIQGKDFSGLMLEWSNHPSAPVALHQQEVGEYAVRDKWDQQIYALIDQVKVLQASLKTSTDTITSLQTQLADMGDRPTKTQYQELVGKIDEANAKIIADQKALDIAQKQVDALMKEKVEAEKTGNLFTRWIGDLINKIAGVK